MADPYPVQNPLSRFNRLFAQAEAIDRSILPEPNAMSLATVGMNGNPSVRMVLMKGVNEDGFVFYTNLDGRKGRQLRTRPSAAICFHWPALEVQVRAEGPVTPVSDTEADEYFATRSRASQIGAWASVQSQPIERVDDLAARSRSTRQSSRANRFPARRSGQASVSARRESSFGRANPDVFTSATSIRAQAKVGQWKRSTLERIGGSTNRIPKVFRGAPTIRLARHGLWSLC